MSRPAIPPASPQALAAVRAIKDGHRWGSYATQRYLESRQATAHYVAAARFEGLRHLRHKESSCLI